MKTISSLLVSLLIVTIISCGPSAQEKAAAEKVRMDSIADATKKAMEAKQSLEVQLDKFNTDLMQTKADLDVAKNEMNKIQEFQFMRTADERQQQVHDQSIRIQTLEKNVSILENNVVVVTQQLNQVNQMLNSH